MVPQAFKDLFARILKERLVVNKQNAFGPCGK